MALLSYASQKRRLMKFFTKYVILSQLLETAPTPHFHNRDGALTSRKRGKEHVSWAKKVVRRVVQTGHWSGITQKGAKARACGTRRIRMRASMADILMRISTATSEMEG